MTPQAAFRRPESVLVVVHVHDGEILLLRRSKPFEFWQSVTGSLQPGETAAAGARRELQEETGLTDQGELQYTGVSRQFTIDPRWRNRFAPGITENIEYEFRYRLAATESVILNTEEHSESAWLTLPEAIARVWSWTNKQALQQLEYLS